MYLNSYEVTQYLYGFACLSMHGYVEKAEICSTVCTQCTDCMMVTKSVWLCKYYFQNSALFDDKFKDVANIKFCTQYEQDILTNYVNRKAYRDSALRKFTVYRWFRHFKDGHQSPWKRSSF